jgi:hypothetical protein
MTITAYHVPNAVRPFKVPVPIEGLLFPPIKNPGVVNSIHQRAVLFPEKLDIKGGVKTKHNSISMEEFPEITKEPMGGESAKGDKGLGKNIPAESDLDLKHLICLMKYPSQCAPCISVSLQQMDFLAEHIYVGIRKGQTLKPERQHSILLCDAPIDTKGG